MKYNSYRFDQVSINYDKMRIPLSSMERANRQGKYRYFGAQGVIDHIDDYIFDGVFLIIAEDGENLKSKKQKIAQIVEGKFWLNNHAHIIQTNEKCDIFFLYYLLNSMDISGYITGSAQPKLSQANLNAIQLNLPDIETQQHVAGMLQLLDRKIELNNRINENLQQQAQAIFEERFITSQYESEQKPLYSFANYINGAAFKTNDFSETGLPIIKIAELKNGITESTQYFSGNKGEKYIVEDKDILFSWSGNPETSIDIFIWTHGKGILNQHTFNVKPLNGRRWFTYLLLKHFKPEFMHIASGKQTTGLGHVTAADLKRLTFVWNEQAMDELENEIAPMMELLYNNMLENKGLAFLRDSLLEKLMTGENDIHI